MVAALLFWIRCFHCWQKWPNVQKDLSYKTMDLSFGKVYTRDKQLNEDTPCSSSKNIRMSLCMHAWYCRQRRVWIMASILNTMLLIKKHDGDQMLVDGPNSGKRAYIGQQWLSTPESLRPCLTLTYVNTLKHLIIPCFCQEEVSQINIPLNVLLYHL